MFWKKFFPIFCNFCWDVSCQIGVLKICVPHHVCTNETVGDLNFRIMNISPSLFPDILEYISNKKINQGYKRCLNRHEVIYQYENTLPGTSPTINLNNWSPFSQSVQVKKSYFIYSRYYGNNYTYAPWRINNAPSFINGQSKFKTKYM